LLGTPKDIYTFMVAKAETNKYMFAWLNPKRITTMDNQQPSPIMGRFNGHSMRNGIALQVI
jgi:hypothetical protein